MFVTLTDNMGKSIDVNPLHVIAIQPANSFYRVVIVGGLSVHITGKERQQLLDKGDEILAALKGIPNETD